MLARRILGAGSLGAAAVALTASALRAQQGGWPNRPIRLIVPVATGGSVDALARLLSRHLGEIIGQGFAVESHGGAGGNIAFELVARAVPDGHTLLAGWDSLAINPAVYRSVAYDPLRDFAPIIHAVSGAQVLAVKPDLPARSLPEFLVLARRQPLSIGSPGNGSIGHLTAEMLKTATGAGWTHVPYRGGGPAATDLLAGHLDGVLLTLAAVIEHCRAGRMRALAVSSAGRVAALPDVPSMAEQGVAGFDVVSWQGWLAPAGTDLGIIGQLNAGLNRVLALPEVTGWLAAQAFERIGGPPEALGALLRADVARWPALVRAAGARLD
jgi:tripartite-type tricarboxylate transporter receptor subunit TctC